MDENEDDVCESQYAFKLNPQGKHIPPPSDRASNTAHTTIIIDGANFAQLAVSVSSVSVPNDDLDDWVWMGLKEAQKVFKRFGNRVQFDPRIEMIMIWL